MKQHHDERHSLRIETLLAESEDLDRAFATSELATCAECAQLVEDHSHLTSRLDALGEDERESMQAALAGPAPAAGAAEAALWEHAMAGSARIDLGFARMFTALAAAAAVVAALVLWQPRPAGLDPTTVLGEGTNGMEPVGRVADFANFRWQHELPAEGWFEIFVYQEAPTGGLELLDKSPRLTKSAWTPAEEVHSAWPDRILWKLEIHSGSMASDPPQGWLQSAERSH